MITINAGEIPLEHWTQNRDIGGGRIIGEGCHFIDLMRFLAGASISGYQVVMQRNKTSGLIQNDVTSINLSFEDGSFAGVIVQAVLEHVVDPYRCVEEIHRVLNEQGVVYAETPFMQQVHGGRYDFTRFTHLGHRRLFRRFEEIESGAVAGPGVALAWAYQYFLLSWASTRLWRTLLRNVARLTSFYLKYFDYYLMRKPGALDAASCCYFMGRKSEHILSDNELLKLYKGKDGSAETP